MSKRNRKDVPVRTYDGSNFFHVSRSAADRMLADGIAFVLAECPRELQLLHAPYSKQEPKLGPYRLDLSLLMGSAVIQSAAQKDDGGRAAKGLVAGWWRAPFAQSNSVIPSKRKN